MTRRRPLALALSAALLAVGLVATAAPAGAATSTTVVESNTADGKACASRCLAPVENLLGADVVLLQEVCQNDLETFVAAHGLHATFSYQSTADPACGNHDRGNAVVSRYALDPIAPVVLTAPHTSTTNRFTLLCAIVHKPGLRLRACSTHLVAGKSVDQGHQVNQIVTATAGPRSNGQRVIVAGDFNMQPGNPDLAPCAGVSRRSTPPPPPG